MKKSAIIAVFVMLSLVLTSCAEDDLAIATVNGEELSKSQYSYYLESFKSQFNSVDWQNEQVEGQNAGEFLKSRVLDEAVKDILIRQKMIEQGHTLSSDDRAQINLQKANFITGNGGKSFYDKFLNQFNMTDKKFEDIIEKDTYKNIMAREIFGHSLSEVSDEEVQRYYKEEMVRVKHVLIMTMDPATNQPKSAADIEAARATATSVMNLARGMVSFDGLIEEYSEDPGNTSDSPGYVFGKNSSMEKNFQEAALALSEGEVSDIVETPYGFHIIKRYPMFEYADYDNLYKNGPQNGDIKQDVTREIIAERNGVIADRVAEWKKDAKIEINEEELKKIQL